MQLSNLLYSKIALPIYGSLIILIYSCNSSDESFYTTYTEDDLSRLPLIRPYVLTNVFTNDDGSSHPWHLQLKSEYKTVGNLKEDFINVRVVNIKGGIIFGGPGNYKERFYPDFWFVIDSKTANEMLFQDRITWQYKLKELGCKNDTLYDIWPIFEKFKENGTLPWVIPNVGVGKESINN